MRRMNEALDDPETSPDLRTAEDRLSWKRLTDIDDLLQNAPVLEAPIGFFERVMAAIAEMPIPQQMRKPAWGLALGLGTALLIGLPALLLVLSQLLSSLTDTAVMGALFSWVIFSVGSVIQFFASLRLYVGAFLEQYPFAPALLSVVVPLSMLWGWWMWYFAANRSRTGRKKGPEEAEVGEKSSL
jgi:hypothetical protein